MRVTIDGVEYIPAKEALANETAIAKGLLSFFWGECSDDKAKELANDPEIRVYVNDSGEGVLLRTVLDEIARRV